MNAAAPKPAVQPEPGVAPVYLTRDDMARHFNPQTPYERMLVNNAALAHERLLRAYGLEHRLFETKDPLELFNNDAQAFKAIARHIAECDRIYRYAIQAIERAIRNRNTAERRQTSTSRPRPHIEFAEPPAIGPSTTANRSATIVPRR